MIMWRQFTDLLAIMIEHYKAIFVNRRPYEQDTACEIESDLKKTLFDNETIDGDDESKKD